MNSNAMNSGLAGLFEVHRSELLRFLAARCGDAAEAEDLLQELWFKSRQANTRPIANGRGYLFRMANNLVLDRARERQRTMRRDRDWLNRDGIGGAAIEERRDHAANAEDALAERQEAELLHRAIETLPNGSRRALLLYRFEGYGQAEVAQIMGISRSGVEKHLAVAMRHLRRKLAGCGFFSAAPSYDQEPPGGTATDGEIMP